MPSTDPAVALGGGHRAACSRSCFSFQTFVFTDGEDEVLARHTGEPRTWGGEGGATPRRKSSPPLSGEVAEATGLGGHFIHWCALCPAPPLRGPPILMQMRPFQLPRPLEQQVAGAGKKPPEWVGAGRGWGGAGRGSPGLCPALGRGRAGGCCRASRNPRPPAQTAARPPLRPAPCSVLTGLLCDSRPGCPLRARRTPLQPLPLSAGNVVNTNCSAAHSRQALSCKMAVEYDRFIASGRK